VSLVMTDLPGWIVAAAMLILGASMWLLRQLWKRWRARLLDRVDEAATRRLSGFPRRYRDHMLRTLRFIDLKGLATIGPHHPELDDVFVDVSLERESPHRIGEGVLSGAPGKATDRQSLSDFLDHPMSTVIAVLGAPGSGKTTLVRYTARHVCQPGRRRRTVPILLYLRDHIADIVADPYVVLPTLLRRQLGPVATGEPAGWFEEQLAGGNCLVLLDGLDEVARSNDRRAVAAWVERQTRQYQKNDFVITSRPQGYRTAPIEGATILQARGFTREQVSRFVHSWYRAVERESIGETTQDVEQRADAESSDLLRRLDNSPELADLTINPLLLTMIANVHRYRGALPGSRVELYSEICQVMLWRRQEAKQQSLELNGERKEALLRGLAFAMMQHQVRDLPRKAVLDKIGNALRRITTTMTAETLLSDVCSNGLLIEREAGHYSFAHLTFQEYLAAMHIRDTGSVALLADFVDDVWWRETTLLYTARSGSDPIVAACLKSGTVTALALAFEIADDADLAPELRNDLEDFLESGNDDPSHRRLRHGVLVTRYLHRFRSNRQTFIPITNEIYAMCVADGYLRGQGEVGRPDEPVKGLWASDTGMFLNWIHNVTGITLGYRLPTRDELDSPQWQGGLVEPPVTCVWVQDGHEYVLWAPDPSNHVNRVHGTTVFSYVVDDFVRLRQIIARVGDYIAGSTWGNRQRFLDSTEDISLITRVPHADIGRHGELLVAEALVPTMGTLMENSEPVGPDIAQLVRIFEDEVKLARIDYDIYPGVSGTEVRTAASSMTDHMPRGIFDKFMRIAAPIFSGEERPVSASLATVIRMTALCMAARADAVNMTDGDIFRKAAAAVTFLEMRASGLSPATEMLVLVPR
jgi:NACHT domain